MGGAFSVFSKTLKHIYKPIFPKNLGVVICPNDPQATPLAVKIHDEHLKTFHCYIFPGHKPEAHIRCGKKSKLCDTAPDYKGKMCGKVR